MNHAPQGSTIILEYDSATEQVEACVKFCGGTVVHKNDSPKSMILSDWVGFQEYFRYEMGLPIYPGMLGFRLFHLSFGHSQFLVFLTS
jgi:hypothetical protein